MKQAVIAPSMLSLLYPLDPKDALEGYSREAFEKDLIDEVRALFALCCEYRNVDCGGGRLRRILEGVLMLVLLEFQSTSLSTFL